MKTKYLRLAIAFVMLIAMSSCKKDQKESNFTSSQYSKENILKFKNYDEYQNTYKIMISYTESERKSWEESNGFKSFGRICDELYFSIKPEQFPNIESAKIFVASNSEYLQLLPEENGEYTLETTLFRNSNRYLINKDKLIQIGESIYKVLEKNTVYSKVEFINKLKSINEKNLLAFKKDNDIHISGISDDKTEVIKNVAANYGRWQENRTTNGNDRTYLRVSVEYTNAPGTREFTEFMIRPYHKVWPIWYYCTRSISCDLGVTTYYYHYNYPSGGYWVQKYDTYPNSGTLADHLSGEITFDLISTYSTASPQGYLSWLNCWASTPSTGPVTLNLY